MTRICHPIRRKQHAAFRSKFNRIENAIIFSSLCFCWNILNFRSECYPAFSMIKLGFKGDANGNPHLRTSRMHRRKPRGCRGSIGKNSPLCYTPNGEWRISPSCRGRRLAGWANSGIPSTLKCKARQGIGEGGFPGVGVAGQNDVGGHLFFNESGHLGTCRAS